MNRVVDCLGLASNRGEGGRRSTKGRITQLIVGDVRYPRFGWGPCDACRRYRLLFYATPERPGVALCSSCLRVRGIYVELPF